MAAMAVVQALPVPIGSPLAAKHSAEKKLVSVNGVKGIFALSAVMATS